MPAHRAGTAVPDSWPYRQARAPVQVEALALAYDRIEIDGMVLAPCCRGFCQGLRKTINFAISRRCESHSRLSEKTSARTAHRLQR
jgi:hypothetical protein